MVPPWWFTWSDFHEEITVSASMGTCVMLPLPPWASMVIPWNFRGTSVGRPHGISVDAPCFYGDFLPGKLPMVLPWCFHSISMRRPWKHVSFIGASMGAPRCFHVCGDFHNASMGIPWGFHGASMVPPCGAAMVPPWCFHGTFVVLPSVALPWCLQLPWSFDGASMGISWCFHDVFSSV